MFPFQNVTDDELQQMGWGGAIDALKETLDMQMTSLEVMMDQLTDQMADMVKVQGVAEDSIYRMAETQVAVFQALTNIGRVEQQIKMMTDLHAFLKRVKAEAATNAAAEA